MPKLKIAIIGAGINGLYLAWKLAEKGFDVTVFERKDKVGKSACSGLFSQRLLEFIPQAKELVKNEIDYAFLHFPKKTVRINFSKKFLVMDHAELDRLVFDLAKKSGAKVLLSQGIESLPRGFDRIIGADGALSKVRQLLSLKDPDFRLGVQGFVKEKDSVNFVETWSTKNGFSWKIPRGKETEYGVMETKEKAKAVFDKFLKERNIKVERIESALIPEGLILTDKKDVVLCGDAAGLTKPWSGGGVIWGLKAANVLLDEFPDFEAYERRLKMSFSLRFAFSRLVTFLVYFLGFNLYYFLPKNVKMENDFLI